MSCLTRVYLVGAGPGDVGLLTLRGKELVQRADAIIYDYLSNAEILAFARPDAELIYVGKKGFDKHITQDDINAILVEKALKLDAAWRARGKRCDRGEQGACDFPMLVRLKGGDPFVFGRGGEEALALRAADVPFEVVPGVTSGIAAPAHAGIPVTHRGLASSVSFVTGNEDPTKNETALDWEALAGMARMGGTLCFYMGMRNLPLISKKLVDLGVSRETPVGLVQWGTTARQRTVVATLGNAAQRAAEAGLEAPVMIVVGPVAGLAEELEWFERSPLFGKRVLVTRSREQASVFSRALHELGAQVIEVPTIEIANPESFGPLDAAIAELERFDWIVFTSANGVRRFFGRLACRPQGPRDARALAGARLAVIGPATAQALRGFGVQADVVPERYVAEAAFDAMVQAGLAPGQRVLVARAAAAREALPQLLEDFGAQVIVAPAYQTVVPAGDTAQRVRSLLDEGGVDAVTFTSSSTARNLAALVGGNLAERLAGVDVFSIGPITTQTLNDLGISHVHEALSFTIPGLVDRMVAAYDQPTRQAAQTCKGEQ